MVPRAQKDSVKGVSIALSPRLNIVSNSPFLLRAGASFPVLQDSIKASIKARHLVIHPTGRFLKNLGTR